MIIKMKKFAIFWFFYVIFWRDGIIKNIIKKAAIDKYSRIVTAVITNITCSLRKQLKRK